ncbi:MAG: hypothetical protein AAFO89_03305 [Planctomycetota bacterium]
MPRIPRQPARPADDLLSPVSMADTVLAIDPSSTRTFFALLTAAQLDGDALACGTVRRPNATDAFGG